MVETILVADDNPQQLAELVDAAQAAAPNAVIITAQSGREAMRKMRLHRPDLTITDLYMAPGTGRDVLRAAKKLRLLARCVTSVGSVSARRSTQRLFASKSEVAQLLPGWLDEAGQSGRKDDGGRAESSGGWFWQRGARAS